MLDRLGRLGDASSNRDNLYSTILMPSALSEWDVGRLGSKAVVARQLLGRLFAYLRLHELSSSILAQLSFSTTFLLWLRNECKSTVIEVPNKAKLKKPKVMTTTFLASIDSACSVLSSIRCNNMIATIENREVAPCKLVANTFHRCEASFSPIDLNLVGDNDRSFMEACMKANKMLALEEFLEQFYSKLRCSTAATRPSLETQAVDLSVSLWQVFHSSVGLHRDTTVLCAWLPRLTRNVGKPELWRLLFQGSSQACVDSLLWKCMSYWTDSHIVTCQEWILRQASTDKADSSYDLGKCAVFLSAASGQSSAIEPIAAVQVGCRSNWAGSKEFVMAATLITLQSLLGDPPTESSLALVRRPRVPAPGLTLLVLLCKVGKKQFRSVCSMVISELTNPMKIESQLTLEVILLRLYLLFPRWMDLGAAVAREALVHAAQNNLDFWSEWTCYWDDYIDGWLDSVAQKGEFGCSKVLIEVSRKQPLLVLRKLSVISAMLSLDASPGVISKRNVVLPPHMILYASTRKGHSMKVSLRLWGDSFSERLWLFCLDVVQAMPAEVLYTILPPWEAFLSLYLELLSSSNMTGQLKGRISDLCVAYRQHNPEQWRTFAKQWDGRDELRSMLESFE
jgi:hypothetical protein